MKFILFEFLENIKKKKLPKMLKLRAKMAKNEF